MQEWANLIANYGVTIIIVGLFLWDWVNNKKDMKDTLEVIKDTSINISKSLDLLQKATERQDEKLDKILDREKSN